MALAEWGPKGVSLDNRSLEKLADFSGSQLKNIDTQVTKYLRTHPRSKVEQAIWHLARSEKEALCIDVGWHTLGQLAVVNRGAEDVASLTLRQDMNSRHLYYEIDWIHEPDQKVEPKPLPEPVAAKTVIYPFITAEQRAENRMKSKKVADKIIRGIVIDEGRNLADQSIRKGLIKIEPGPEGSAVILVKPAGITTNPDGTTKYIQVDRATGQYHDGSSWHDIKPEVLRYLDTLAKQLEGKAVTYTPNHIDPGTLQAIYQHVINRIILVKQNPQTGVEFYYREQLKQSGRQYVKINLEQGAIEVQIVSLLSKSTITKHLNPQFVEFLKKKKVELEQKPVSSTTLTQTPT